MYYLIKLLVIIFLSLLFLSCQSSKIATPEFPSATNKIEGLKMNGGIYSSEPEKVVKIFIQDEKFYLQMQGNPRFELSKTDDQYFYNHWAAFKPRSENKDSRTVIDTSEQRGGISRFKLIG